MQFFLDWWSSTIGTTSQCLGIVTVYKKISSYNRCKTENRVLYARALRICAIGLSVQQLFYGNKIEDIVVTTAWHVSYRINVSSIYKVDITLPLANSLILWSSSSRRTVRASLMLLGRIGEHHPHFSAKALQATIIPGQSDKSCRCRCWLLSWPSSFAAKQLISVLWVGGLFPFFLNVSAQQMYMMQSDPDLTSYFLLHGCQVECLCIISHSSITLSLSLLPGSLHKSRRPTHPHRQSKLNSKHSSLNNGGILFFIAGILNTNI